MKPERIASAESSDRRNEAKRSAARIAGDL
jgi:hypothetical protein